MSVSLEVVVEFLKMCSLGQYQFMVPVDVQHGSSIALSLYSKFLLLKHSNPLSVSVLSLQHLCQKKTFCEKKAK